MSHENAPAPQLTLEDQRSEPSSVVAVEAQALRVDFQNEVVNKDHEEALEMANAQNPQRLLVRGALRMANLADKAASWGTATAEKWDNRRTLRGVASDTRKSAQETVATQVERGRGIAKKVGATVVENAKLASLTAEVNYKGVKEIGGEQVGRVRGYFKQRAEAARGRREQRLAGLRYGKDRAVTGVKQAAETGREHGVRAARVGKEVLKVSALLTLGVSLMAGEAAAKGTKSAARLGAEAGRSTVASAKNVAEKGARVADKHIIEVMDYGHDKKENVKVRVGNTVESGRQAKARAESKVQMVHGDVVDLRAGITEKRAGWKLAHAERKHARVDRKLARAKAGTQAAAHVMNNAATRRARAQDIRVRAARV